MGRGVSRCATCDGGFYRGKDVAVVGGGDGAVHEALTLAKTSSRVFVVARRPLRAKREYIDKLAARDNVTFLWDSEVTTIEGENAVTGLALRNLRNGETSEIAVAGVFPFIGTTPNTGFLPAALRDATGHVPTDAEFASTDPRLFAAGAARAGFGGSAVQAMAEGVSAAMASVKHFAQLSS